VPLVLYEVVASIVKEAPGDGAGYRKTVRYGADDKSPGIPGVVMNVLFIWLPTRSLKVLLLASIPVGLLMKAIAMVVGREPDTAGKSQFATLTQTPLEI
jgi:hypothetical protein